MAKKIQLNANKRNTIRRFLFQDIEANSLLKERAARDKAVARVELVAARIAKKAFPAEDMAVLRKYKSAGNYSNIRVRKGCHYPELYDLTEPIEQPDRADGRIIDLPDDHRLFKLDKQARDAGRAYNDALTDLKAEYLALLKSATYFEDIVAVLPEVEALRARFTSTGTAVAIMSPDVVDKLVADAAARARVRKRADAETPPTDAEAA